MTTMRSPPTYDAAGEPSPCDVCGRVYCDHPWAPTSTDGRSTVFVVALVAHRIIEAMCAPEQSRGKRRMLFDERRAVDVGASSITPDWRAYVLAGPKDEVAYLLGLGEAVQLDARTLRVAGLPEGTWGSR